MAIADELEQSRAEVIMINAMPYNAEAPPAALDGDITPTEYHYIRSNFPVPAHEGTLEVGGAVASSAAWPRISSAMSGRRTRTASRWKAGAPAATTAADSAFMVAVCR